jgi:hypothetical protein
MFLSFLDLLPLPLQSQDGCDVEGSTEVGKYLDGDSVSRMDGGVPVGCIVCLFFVGTGLGVEETGVLVPGMKVGPVGKVDTSLRDGAAVVAKIGGTESMLGKGSVVNEGEGTIDPCPGEFGGSNTTDGNGFGVSTTDSGDGCDDGS